MRKRVFKKPRCGESGKLIREQAKEGIKVVRYDEDFHPSRYELSSSESRVISNEALGSNSKTNVSEQNRGRRKSRLEKG